MKTKMFSLLVVCSMILTMLGTALPAAATAPTISIDGSVGDWAGIEPTLMDHGISGTNISDVYFASDATNVYVRIDGTQIGPGMPIHIDIDKDQSLSTGYDTNTDSANLFNATHDVGADYDIAINMPTSSGNPPNFTFFNMTPSGGAQPIPATGMSVAVGGGGSTTNPFNYEIAIPFALIDHAPPWNFVFSTGMPQGSASADELPSQGYATYPLGSGTPLPDLTVPSILSDWVNADAGIYNVRFTIVNNSLTPAPASHARFSVNGTLASEIIDVPSLAATGGGNTATFTSTDIALSQGGSDIVVVYADGGTSLTELSSEIVEQDENNNSHSITVTPDLGWAPKADLVVNEVHAEWNPPTGGGFPPSPPNTYKVHFAIVNASPTAAPASHVKLVINNDTEHPVVLTVPALGASGTHQAFFVGPFTITGTDTIVVTADSGSEVDEQFENNNNRTYIWNYVSGLPTAPNLMVAEAHETWNTPNAATSTYSVAFNIANAVTNPMNPSATNAGPYTVYLKINGEDKEHIHYSGLASMANQAGSFSGAYNVTGAYDTVQVYTSLDNSAPELFTNDNSLTSIWNAKPTPPVALTTPPVVLTVSPATSVTDSSATLHGNLTGMGTVNGNAVTSATAFFEIGLTSAYGSATAFQPMTATGTFAAIIPLLQPNTLYHYRAHVFGPAGEALGDDATFTTE
ncbi:MAG: CARDB domain-containing protein, partial [Dehalococcoidales bacterium]|nr:CARDB domain-containing protein [Dehalococcoidales bacterium]